MRAQPAGEQCITVVQQVLRLSVGVGAGVNEHEAVAAARDDGGQRRPVNAFHRAQAERAAGHESGIAYDLSEPVTLGRGDVEIRLEDPFASSQHVRISREGHTVVIEDLGSTNGTFLNDSPLTGPQPLHDGDRIRIGDSEFQYLQ